MDFFKDIKEKQQPIYTPSNYLDQLENKYNLFKEKYEGKYTEKYLQEQLDKLRVDIDNKKKDYETNLINFKNEYLKNGYIKYDNNGNSKDIDFNALSEFKNIMASKGYSFRKEEHQEVIYDFMDGRLNVTTTKIYFN